MDIAASQGFFHILEQERVVSRSLKWYSEHFNDDIVWFFRQYAQGKLREGIKRQTRETNLKYLE